MNKKIMWLSAILVVLILSAVNLFIMNGNTFRCKGVKEKDKEVVIVYRKIPHVDNLFNHDYLHGDTACFELINPNTDSVDIRLRCVCKCEEYKNKKNVQ